MKYLLQAIEANRDCVPLSDAELRQLLVEVRNGKDDRLEFIESMTRLLDELRSSEHATAFLNKVAKREAPDYYEVIKNPMDLGTMLRNVKNGRYKSKAQFTRDLDLIWDNCLTYNSEPTHPLRRSVQFMRSKANHLLAYVNDTNDVKQALNQWEASAGLSTTTTNGVSQDSALGGGIPWADGMVLDGPDGTPFDASMTGSSTNGKGSKRDGKLVNGAGAASLAWKRARVMADVPFEQKPALSRTSEGMSTYLTTEEAVQREDERWSSRYFGTKSASSVGGPSSRPLDAFMGQPGEGLSEHTAADLLRTLDVGADADVLRTALTAGVEDRDRRSPISQGKQRAHYMLDASDNASREKVLLGAWWSAQSHPSLLPSGVAALPSSERLNSDLTRVIGRPKVRRRRRTLASRQGGQVGQGEGVGGIDGILRNIRTIQSLRRTHSKFGELARHLERDEALPAWLAVASSDEEDEDDNEDEEEAEDHREGGRYREAEWGPMTGRESRMRKEGPPPLAAGRNPFERISSQGARDIVRHRSQYLLAHAGFEGSQKQAADVISEVAAEYIMGLGKTLCMYKDKFAHEMSVEEMILHTLFENGRADIRSLETYIVDDVERYGSKLSDLLRKLRSSYRDQLQAQDNLAMEDEEQFFDHNVAVEEDDEQGERPSGQLVSGNFAGELGDDFFGFKALGLDAELGLKNLSVPMRLFQANGSANGVHRAGQAGRITKAGQGKLDGVPANSTGLQHGKDARSANGSLLPFEPPPPFLVIDDSAIPTQIGLLQGWYRDCLRARGTWIPIDADGQEIVNSAKDAPKPRAEEAVNGSEGERKADEGDASEGREGQAQGQTVGQMKLVLPDEEMERQRYKVPPSGKMPRRDMAKDRKPPPSAAVPGGKKTKDVPSKTASLASTTQQQQQQQQQQEALKRKSSSDKKSTSSSKKKQKGDD